MQSKTDSQSPKEDIEGKINSFIEIFGGTRQDAEKILEICYFNLHEAVCHQANLAEEQSNNVESKDPANDLNPSKSIHKLVPLRNFRHETEHQENRFSMNENDVNAYVDIFAPPIDILFYGDFNDAKSACQSSCKWLLTHFHDPTIFNSIMMNRDIWANGEIKKLLRQYFIFWQCDVHTEDGYKLKSFYKCSIIPYVAIIDPRTGEKVAYWEYLDNAPYFLSKLQHFINERPSYDENITVGANIVKHNNSPIHLDSIKMSSLTEDEQLQLAIQNSLIDNMDLPFDCMEDVNFNRKDTSRDQTNKPGTSSNSSACQSTNVSPIRSPITFGKDHDTSSLPPGKPIPHDMTVITFMFPWGEKLRVIWSNKTTMKSMLSFLKKQYTQLEQTQITLKTSFPSRNLCKLPINTTLLDAKIHPSAVIHIFMDDE